MDVPLNDAAKLAQPISKIIELSIKGASKVPAAVRKATELHNILGAFTEKYILYCQEIYKNMRILAMPQPIALQNLYTSVRVLDQIESASYKTEKEILEEFLKGKHERSTSISALDVAQSESRIVLLGRPGSGKSTFLRYFLLRELGKSDTLTHIPVLIDVKQVDPVPGALVAAIKKIFLNCGMEFADPLVDKLLKDGKLRLLVDGLDELRSTERTAVVSELDQISKKYRECRFVVSCRSSAYEFWFHDFKHYEIEKFSLKSINSFVEKWFSGDRNKSQELQKQIASHTRLRDLCSNPLMLTIVCIGFSGGLDVSNNRAEIYRDAIDTLLKRWDSTRSIHRDNRYRSLTPKRREELLARLAAATFFRDEIVISTPRAAEIIEEFLATVSLDDDVELAEDAIGALEAIETQHGVVAKRAKTSWTFAHLTFHEYFVAQFLCAHDENLRHEIASLYIDRPDWREVIILTASLLPNADTFVLDILQSMTKMGFGAHFIKKVNTAIFAARAESRAKAANLENLLKKNKPSELPKRSATKLRLIEGGGTFNLVDMRGALDRFRSVVANRRNTPAFHVLFEYIELSEGRYTNYYEYERKVSINLSITSSPLLSTVMRKRLIDDMKAYHEDATSLSMSKISKNNANILKKLDQAFTPSNIFEITDRKHHYVVPECVEACIQDVSGILESMNFDGVDEIFRERVAISKEGRWLDAFKPALKEECIKLIRETAEANAAESLKLRALVAGETLAEILLSPVSLSARVREAAMQTLGNLIRDPPKGPSGPQAGEAAQPTG